MKKKLIGSLVLGAMLATAPTAAMAEVVTINLGDPLVTVDAGSHVMREVAGVNEEGIILVPVRDVAEAFGGTVVYDEGQNIVKLTFPNGNWANIAIEGSSTGAADGAVAALSDGMVDKGTFINDRLYVPATLMATCLGGRVELIDYQRDEVFRLIYYVR